MVVAGKIEVAADDVSCAVLRSPHRRRQRGGVVPGAREGRRGGSAPSVAGGVSSDSNMARTAIATTTGPLPDCEVCIHGQPVSAQTARRQALQAWKQRVRACTQVPRSTPHRGQVVVRVRTTQTYCDGLVSHQALQGGLLSGGPIIGTDVASGSCRDVMLLPSLRLAAHSFRSSQPRRQSLVDSCRIRFEKSAAGGSRIIGTAEVTVFRDQWDATALSPRSFGPMIAAMTTMRHARAPGCDA